MRFVIDALFILAGLALLVYLVGATLASIFSVAGWHLPWS
jgi:hypothetical protein